MSRNSGIYICSLFLICIFASCKTDNSNSTVNSVITDSAAATKDSLPAIFSGKFDMVISDIPFPFEILDNLYSNKIPFSQNLMNDIGNSSKYNQYNSKALNLGIYGADLSYAVTYEQFQKIGAYVKGTKKLADDLNIPFAFDNNMMDKYNKYKDNKDSLTRIVYDSYNQVDKSLKGDERVGIAALVVTGSWLEGLYLSTKSYIDAPKTTDNSNLYKVIGGQRQSLNIVIKLLDEYKKDAYINNLITDLKGITSEYNTISSSNMMNEAQLVLINAKVEKLRTKIINGQ
jgi:hypothetical protein